MTAPNAQEERTAKLSLAESWMSVLNPACSSKACTFNGSLLMVWRALTYSKKSRIGHGSIEDCCAPVHKLQKTKPAPKAARSTLQSKRGWTVGPSRLDGRRCTVSVATSFHGFSRAMSNSSAACLRTAVVRSFRVFGVGICAVFK